jgi:hypothetical protein
MASMGRKTDQRTEKVERLGKALRGMFKKLENRPTPDHIRTVVEQLEAADRPAKKAETA